MLPNTLTRVLHLSPATTHLGPFREQTCLNADKHLNTDNTEFWPSGLNY